MLQGVACWVSEAKALRSECCVVLCYVMLCCVVLCWCCRLRGTQETYTMQVEGCRGDGAGGVNRLNTKRTG